MNTRLGQLGAGVQREPHAFTQRSVVKVSYARNAKSASWAAHGRYLVREGAQRKDAKGLGFDSARDDINLSQLLARWQLAPVQIRIAHLVKRPGQAELSPDLRGGLRDHR